MKTPTRSPGVTKAELMARIGARTPRYGVTLTASQLDGWIDGGLMPKGERRGNAGRRPLYSYSRRHYRRALQISRLYAHGIKDRDAVLVQLFVRQYGVAAWEVGASLEKEFRRAAARVVAPIRSVESQRTGDIPPGRMASLGRQMGDLDPRLAETGFRMSAMDLVSALRVAVGPEGSLKSPPLPTATAPGLDVLMGTLWPKLLPAIAGTLAVDEEHPSAIENAISSASPNELYRARIAFNAARSLFKAFSGVPLLAPFGGGMGGVPGMLVAKSFLQREWCAFCLGNILNLFQISRRNGIQDINN